MRVPHGHLCFHAKTAASSAPHLEAMRSPEIARKALMSLLLILEFTAALGVALMAGLYFIFSVAIMTALARIAPASGMAAMQSINVVILNPWFLLAFAGTAVVCAVLAVMALLRWSEPGAALLLVACALYLVGNIVVTMVFNVPLNNALAAADPASTGGAALWSRYLSTWTAWNHVRTLSCLAALALLIGTIYVQAKAGG
jgi:uncharacterized membrane protein